MTIYNVENCGDTELTPTQVMAVIKRHFTNKEVCIQAYCAFLDETGGYENELHNAQELAEFLNANAQITTGAGGVTVPRLSCCSSAKAARAARKDLAQFKLLI